MKLAVLSLAVVALLAPISASTTEAAPPAGRQAQYARSARAGFSPQARNFRRYDGRRVSGTRYYGGRYYGGNRYYGGRYYGGRYYRGRGYYPYYGVGFYPFGYYGSYYGGGYYGTGVSIGYETPVYDEAPYPNVRRSGRVYEGKIVAETAPRRR